MLCIRCAVHVCHTFESPCSPLTHSLISKGYSFQQSALFCSVFLSCEPTLVMTRLETPAITSPQYCFLLDSFLISRRSKKQFIVSYLNNKAKYRTLSHDDVFHVQIKYIEIDCHFVRRLHQDSLKLLFVHSQETCRHLYKVTSYGTFSYFS